MNNQVVKVTIGGTVLAAAVTWYLWKSGKLWGTNDNEQDEEPSKKFGEKATTVQEMVARLKKMKMVTSPRVAATLLKIDRKYFVDEPDKNLAYFEQALPIGFNATISAPHMHGLGLDLIVDRLTPGAKVLDIGSGSGFMSACFAELIGPTGEVYGVEHIQELVDQSIINIKKCNPALLDRITLTVGDGFKGLAEHGPYDCIYVGAAADKIPQDLVDQLKIGGRLLIPVGPPNGFHQLMQVDVTQSGEISAKSLGAVRFVPLTTRENQITGSDRGGVGRMMKTADGRNLLVLPNIVPAPDSDPSEYYVTLRPPKSTTTSNNNNVTIS